LYSNHGRQSSSPQHAVLLLLPKTGIKEQFKRPVSTQIHHPSSSGTKQISGLPLSYLNNFQVSSKMVSIRSTSFILVALSLVSSSLGATLPPHHNPHGVAPSLHEGMDARSLGDQPRIHHPEHGQPPKGKSANNWIFLNAPVFSNSFKPLSDGFSDPHSQFTREMRSHLNHPTNQRDLSLTSPEMTSLSHLRTENHQRTVNIEFMRETISLNLQRMESLL